MIGGPLHVTQPFGRATRVVIAVVFMAAMPGVVPGDCPHHQTHQSEHDPLHSSTGDAADPGETAPTPCSCMDDCQNSRPVALPNGASDHFSFGHVVEIQTNLVTTPVQTLVSYRIPYAHGPPEQL